MPAEAIPFDMFRVERLATIVHDLDLKDGSSAHLEASMMGTLIDGLQLAHADDEALLTHGIALFDVLFRGFEH